MDPKRYLLKRQWISGSVQVRMKDMKSSNNNNNREDKELAADRSSINQNFKSALLFSSLGILLGLLLRDFQQKAPQMIDSKDPSLFRGLNGLKEEYDLVIVGAGLSGS